MCDVDEQRAVIQERGQGIKWPGCSYVTTRILTTFEKKKKKKKKAGCLTPVG